MTEQEFWEIWCRVEPPAPIFYRAYYNDQGWVESYSMEDLPGNYIEVDQPTYALAPRARVVDNKLIAVKPASVVHKLVPSDQGTSCHPQDICIVINSSQAIKWSIKTNETN